MIEIQEVSGDKVVLEVSGTLEKSDYDNIMPQLEHAVGKLGPVRALVVMTDFHGWTPPALIEELRFDLRHRQDIKRCAVVGDSAAEGLLTKLASPLFSGETRYFPMDKLVEAEHWLDEAN